jgi:probable phosphoglycerate mutase
VTIVPIAFWYLRHGETDWNAQGLSQGSTDIPLNETGLAQAANAATLLRHRGVVTIVASPLGRAATTARIVAEVLDLAVETDADLREVAFGEQEGRPMGTWYDSWIAGEYTPLGAETFADLRTRATAAINRALARPAPVLVVAHGGLFRAIRAAMGLEVNVRTPNAIPMFCEPGSPWTLTAAK